jgi:chemotaxis protein histidine kinase CheA
MSDDDMDEVMVALRLQFIAALPGHADAIRRAWHDFTGDADAGSRRHAAGELLHRAHRLAGGGAMVGFSAISDAAGPVEEMVRGVIEGDSALAVPPGLPPLIVRLLAECDVATSA